MIISYYTPEYKDCVDLIRKTWGDSLVVERETLGGWQNNVEQKPRFMLEIWDRLPKQFVYLDADCYLAGNLDWIYKQPSDITVTRMVGRGSHPTINSAVIGFRKNSRTKRFLEDWVEGCSEGNHRLREQDACHRLAFQAYDGLKEYSVGNVSENLYNCEASNSKDLKEKVKKYNPHVIHFKQQMWQDKNFVNEVMSLSKRLNVV